MPKKGTTRFKSNLQEKKVAKELSGRQQINSGAFWSLPGDVRTDNLLCECKTTEKNYYSLSVTTWLKIRSEAVNDGLRIPVMCIDLENGKTRVAIIDDKSFIDYKNYWDYCSDYTYWTDRKSICVNKECIGTKILFSKYAPSINLQVIAWDNFINIIKQGEKV